MSQLGERFRLARENQGLPIAQVALETRILQRYLIALEEGDFQQLPGDVYARGFVRNYAQYLGLPPDEMIENYRRERGASDTIRVVPAASAPKVRSYVLPNFFGVFFITIVLLGLAYFGLSALGRIGAGTEVAVSLTSTPLPATPTSLATQAAVSVPLANTLVVPTQLPTAVVAPTNGGVAGGEAQVTVPTVAPPPSPTSEVPITVRVNVKPNTNGSWLRVQVDGDTVFEGVMRAGDTQDFQAKRRVLIRSGNPAVVFVSVNGLEPQVLSPLAGKPTNWQWPPQ